MPSVSPSHECPIGVISLGEDRVTTPAAYLMNHPLEHDASLQIRGAIGWLLGITHRVLVSTKPALMPLVGTCRRDNAESAANKVTTRNTHTTHANTVDTISFGAVKLGSFF